MTKYGIISDGYAKHLKYLYEYKFLFLFTIKKWKYVWWPYYDKIWGRSLDTSGYNGFVCTYNNNLNTFVEKWPYIIKYFEWAEKEQNHLELKATEYKSKIDEKKNKIEYL